MKKSLLSLTALFIYSLLFSQFKQVAEGPVFDEPVDGFAKILQLKNGSTMFFHINIRKGIDIRVYDAAHKEKATSNIEPAYGKLQSGQVEGIFEINGDAVLLISEVDARTPVLYRLIIDSKNGNLKEEKKLAELQSGGLFAGYAMIYGGVPAPDFFVRKDPNSDNYAVAMFNSFESERSKRIEVVFYGSDNQEMSRAYYASPDEKYKYLQYIDMAVIGADKVSVLVYGYNTKNSGGKESELILANLEKGAKTVSFNELNFPKNVTVSFGITRYNPVTRQLILLASVKEDKKSHTYTPYLVLVDPFAQKMLKDEPVFPSPAALNKSTEVFGKRDKFTGLPQNLFINDDGGFTIIYEELTLKSFDRNTSTGAYFYTVTDSELGDLVVSNHDKAGVLIASYFIPKNQYIASASIVPFYHSVRENTAQLLKGGNQFKSFAYLNGINKSFVLFNDTERNNDAATKGKVITIQGVSESDGFYYPIEGTDVIPKRDFVFGAPPDKRTHNLALFSISDYSRKNNLYVTLKLEKEGRSKGVKLVWLQP